MATSLENFGTLEYVQDKYSKLWCWKITGNLAIDKISSLTSKAWYGENENEVIIIDYKSDKIKLEEIEKKTNKYTDQLGFYKKIIQEIYPSKKIICAILWTYLGEISFIENKRIYNNTKN